MLREYVILFVNMASLQPSPEEAEILIQVNDLAEEQIEEYLLNQTRNQLSQKFKTEPRDIAVHGFTLISQRPNTKVT
ncbi:hypothetical protein HBO07_27280 [Pseudomonas proteolytica]|uniref:hypothetical protein n=1 Tax=Pseudomonas proteolytica TaxID=219574 RepID=UPI00147314EA|nr:hypothetical protein [Pseudomonas proteolytica]NMZ14966.1 hypothetical protein [Pseudomonas proteolytica]